MTGRSPRIVFLSHVGGFLFLLFAAYWLRRISLEPDPLLQGYLQVISGLLAFVFAAVTLVRFQGTQDRISLILGAGLVFELPMITYFLTKIGIINPIIMRKYRRHSIVGILIISAIVTPTPDILTQSLLAVPMILLYEISIFISKFAKNKSESATT